MSIPTMTKLTYDDLVALQSRPEYEFHRLELIDGVLNVSPTPSPFHQIRSANLMFLLGAVVIKRQLGLMLPARICVRLSSHDIIEPDIVFIARKRLHIIGPTLIDGAPDLVIEILSPSTRRRDLTTKKALYERFGVPEYWIVDPDARAVSVFALVHGKYQFIPSDDGLVHSTVIAECAISLADVFDLHADQP